MAEVTWQNVAGPNYGAVNQLLASQQRGYAGLANIARQLGSDRDKFLAREAQLQQANITSQQNAEKLGLLQAKEQRAADEYAAGVRADELRGSLGTQDYAQLPQREEILTQPLTQSTPLVLQSAQNPAMKDLVGPVSTGTNEVQPSQGLTNVKTSPSVPDKIPSKEEIFNPESEIYKKGYSTTARAKVADVLKAQKLGSVAGKREAFKRLNELPEARDLWNDMQAGNKARKEQEALKNGKSLFDSVSDVFSLIKSSLSGEKGIPVKGNTIKRLENKLMSTAKHDDAATEEELQQVSSDAGYTVNIPKKSVKSTTKKGKLLSYKDYASKLRKEVNTIAKNNDMDAITKRAYNILIRDKLDRHQKLLDSEKDLVTYGTKEVIKQKTRAKYATTGESKNIKALKYKAQQQYQQDKALVNRIDSSLVADDDTDAYKNAKDRITAYEQYK